MASHASHGSYAPAGLARTVTIKVRYSDFTTITRSHTAEATRDPSDLTARAVRLLEKTDAGRRPVRLLGVSLHNFTAEAEPAPEDRDRLPFGGTKDTEETKV
jgi:DNA polymerase-4